MDIFSKRIDAYVLPSGMYNSPDSIKNFEKFFLKTDVMKNLVDAENALLERVLSVDCGEDKDGKHKEAPIVYENLNIVGDVFNFFKNCKFLPYMYIRKCIAVIDRSEIKRQNNTSNRKY